MKTERPQVVSCKHYAQPAVTLVKGYCQSAASVLSPRNKDDST